MLSWVPWVPGPISPPQSIPILTPSKKPPPAPAPVISAPAGSAVVEFALPKLPKLVKSQSVAEPAPPATSTPAPKRPRATPPARLTVKEAAAGKTRVMEEPPVKAQVPGTAAEAPVGTGTRLLVGTGTRLPAVEVAAPKIAVGLSLAGAALPAAPQAKEPAVRLPQLEVAVPPLPLPAVPPEPGPTLNQPQMKVGKGDAPGSGRKGGGSPVPKPKLPNFSAAEEGAAGLQGGFAGIRVPSIAIAVPSATVELVPELGAPKAEPTGAGGQPQAKLPARQPEAAPAAPARLTFPALAVPSIDIAVPRVGVGLAAPEEGDGNAMPEVATRFVKGLRKLSLELEPTAPLPAVEIATPARLAGAAPATVAKPKPPKFSLPRFGLPFAKPKPGSDGDGQPPAAAPAQPGGAGAVAALDLALGMGDGGGAGVKVKVPKLALAPFGVKDGEKAAGGEESRREAGAGMKLPWLGIGGSEGGDQRKSGEPGSPGTPRLRIPQVGIALPATGSQRVPSLPKLPAGPELGRGVKLPKFGGSSPDLRVGWDPKVMRRGGSAESLSAGAAGRKRLESPSMIQWKLKTGGAGGEEGAQAPWFAVPAVGFTVPVKQAEPGSQKIPKATSVPALKVPALELAPPGMDGLEETGRKATAQGRLPRVKLPKFGAGFAGSRLESEGRMMRLGGVKKAVLVLVKPKEKGEDNQVVDPHAHVNEEEEAKAPRWRWVPRVGFSPGGAPPEPSLTQPKAGKMQLPTVELATGAPEFNKRPVMMEVSPPFNLGGFGGSGTPKFQLPKLVLSPQLCGEQ